MGCLEAMNKYKEYKTITKILEYKDENLDGQINTSTKCYICGRILRKVNLPGEYPLCSDECRELFNKIENNDILELSHNLQILRIEMREKEKKDFLDMTRKNYESGDYETSDLTKHFSD